MAAPALLLLGGLLAAVGGLLVGALVFIAAFTLVERKLMGLQQRREGPDRVGFEGLGQPFADGLKLLRKETLLPKDSPDHRLFLLAPLLSLWVSLLLWGLLPAGPAGALCAPEVGLPLLLGLAGLGSYGTIYSGWASNSKYALLGSFRAVGQFISYELVMSTLFLPLLGATATANLGAIAAYQAAEGWFAYLLPLWSLVLLTLLLETNRTPGDLPEAEAELVAGFSVEFGAIIFALFFLAEYGAMGLWSGIVAVLFFGGATVPAGAAAALGGLGAELLGVLLLALKIQLGAVFFVVVRAALPRLRFDNILQLCWVYLFPLVLSLSLLATSLHHSATL